MRHAVAVLVLALSFASPALADAVTYKGTLGKLPIVVEIADHASPEGLSFGRYAYMSKGIDIPLDPIDAKPGTFAFAEQSPCAEKTCTPTDDGTVITDGPHGATWKLQPDGDDLTGTWRDGDKSLPVKLTPIGSREIPDGMISNGGNLAEVANSFFSDDSFRLTPETDPYDYAKMQVDQTISGATDWDGMRFHYEADPRVGVAVPRIDAARDTDLTAANAYLTSRQYGMQADAFSCESMVYAAMGYMGADFGGNLGGWEDETVAVTYLSPQVLGWTEGGSLWCAGAYPDNHFEHYALDLATGEPLDMSKIFDGWDGTPPERLVEFIKANREHDSDAAWEEECGIDDLIGQYLAVQFNQDATVTFTLDSLPHAINACGMDLYTAPLLDLVPYLTNSAENYFPALAD
jgi:hypothetical protein